MENTTHRADSAQGRSFVITPAKLQDVRRLADIEFSAFENEQVNQVLSFRDYKKPAHFERTVKIYRNALKAEMMCERPLKGQFRKIVETTSGEIISFAKVERGAYTGRGLQQPLDIGHETEPKMNRDWFALNERLRREHVGLDEHIYIGMLATEPKHQHRGAGTMLLEDIISEADEAGIEVYLEATDTAKPLYEKHRFAIVQELRFDPALYGLRGLSVERQTVMVRRPKGSQ